MSNVVVIPQPIAWKAHIKSASADDVPIHARTRLHARHAHVRAGNAAATKIRSFARQGYLASGGFKGSRLNVITIIKLSEREWTLGYKYLSFLTSCIRACVCVCVRRAACTIGYINGTVRPRFQGLPHDTRFIYFPLILASVKWLNRIIK